MLIGARERAHASLPTGKNACVRGAALRICGLSETAFAGSLLHTASEPGNQWHAPSFKSGFDKWASEMERLTIIGLSNADIFAALLAMLVIAILAAVGVVVSRQRRLSRSSTVVPDEQLKLIPKLSSDALAGLIVQALIDGKILEGNKFDDAARIAARKIDLRKALGDY